MFGGKQILGLAIGLGVLVLIGIGIFIGFSKKGGVLSDNLPNQGLANFYQKITSGAKLEIEALVQAKGETNLDIKLKTLPGKNNASKSLFSFQINEDLETFNLEVEGRSFEGKEGKGEVYLKVSKLNMEGLQRSGRENLSFLSPIFSKYLNQWIRITPGDQTLLASQVDQNLKIDECIKNIQVKSKELLKLDEGIVKFKQRLKVEDIRGEKVVIYPVEINPEKFVAQVEKLQKKLEEFGCGNAESLTEGEKLDLKNALALLNKMEAVKVGFSPTDKILKLIRISFKDDKKNEQFSVELIFRFPQKLSEIDKPTNYIDLDKILQDVLMNLFMKEGSFVPPGSMEGVEGFSK